MTKYSIQLNVTLFILAVTIAKCAYMPDYQWITISVLFSETIHAL